SRKIGFIGTGTITDAIVRGLLLEPIAGTHIVVSRRGTKISTKLATDFPQVGISDNNQAILESCDTIVLAIRPQIAEEVIRPLRFHRKHKVISLIAGTDRSTLLEWIGTEVCLTQAIPLPFVARRNGVTAI